MSMTARRTVCITARGYAPQPAGQSKKRGGEDCNPAVIGCSTLNPLFFNLYHQKPGYGQSLPQAPGCRWCSSILAIRCAPSGGCHRKRLKDCQKHFSKRAVHDSRVATRRLLSTIELLETFLPEMYRTPRKKPRTKPARKYFDYLRRSLRDTQNQLYSVARLAKAASRRAVRSATGCTKRRASFTRETCKATRGTQARSGWLPAHRRAGAGNR